MSLKLIVYRKFIDISWLHHTTVSQVGILRRQVGIWDVKYVIVNHT